MNDRLAELDSAVARAVDAWFTDPADTGVYARLVSAVLARRAHLHPRLDDPAGGQVTPPAADTPELLDALAETAPATPVSDLLTGDPREVIERLRRG